MRRTKATSRRISIRLIGPICLIFLIAPLAHAQNDSTNVSPTPAATAPPAAPDATTPPTAQVTGQNTAAPAQPQEEIADIRPPFFYLHSWLWLWILLAAAAIAALLYIIWKGVNRSPFLSPKSAYELTLEKLEQARALLREDDPVPYAVFVSETIRSYLVHRYQTPSTRRTTEEFLRLMEADQASPLAEHRDLLRSFLQSCDLVKFAKYQPTQAELEEVQQRALTFVHATKPAPEVSANGRKP